jgi:hypothetical protein
MLIVGCRDRARHAGNLCALRHLGPMLGCAVVLRRREPGSWYTSDRTWLALSLDSRSLRVMASRTLMSLSGVRRQLVNTELVA